MPHPLRIHPPAGSARTPWWACCCSSVAAVQPSVGSFRDGAVTTPNPLSATVPPSATAAVLGLGGHLAAMGGAHSSPESNSASAAAASAATTEEEIALKVAVVVRPLLAREIAAQPAGAPDVLEVLSPQQLRVRVNDSASIGERTFSFDAVLQHAPPSAVYDATAAYVLSRALCGFNGCVFAYGLTGSGKTYTMEGSGATATDTAASQPASASSVGIIPRLATDLFEALARAFAIPLTRAAGSAPPLRLLPSTSVAVQYVELYSEVLRDLLVPPDTSVPRPRAGTGADEGGGDLVLRQRSDGSIFVDGATTRTVTSAAELLRALAEGSTRRARGETAMNAASSRSHAILTLHLTLVVAAPGEEYASTPLRTGTTRRAKLHLIDLAGSERQKVTLASGDRLKEASGINASLSALGGVISALTTPGRPHIPYRDSKLTRLLQDSLGGNAVVAMICCVSPAGASADETLSSLRFAERAKRVKNIARVNVSKEDAARAVLEAELVAARARMGLLEAALARRLGVRADDRAAIEAELRR